MSGADINTRGSNAHTQYNAQNFHSPKTSPCITPSHTGCPFRPHRLAQDKEAQGNSRYLLYECPGRDFNSNFRPVKLGIVKATRALVSTTSSSSQDGHTKQTLPALGSSDGVSWPRHQDIPEGFTDARTSRGTSAAEAIDLTASEGTTVKRVRRDPFNPDETNIKQKVMLSTEQQGVLKHVLRGNNIFFTGSAGMSRVSQLTSSI